MAYDPYLKRINFDPILTAGLLETLIGKVNSFNARIAPIESDYIALRASAGGAVNENAVQELSLDALQDQLISLSSYITNGALSSIPVNTATNYANFPPFAVRATGIEARLNTIGA